MHVRSILSLIMGDFPVCMIDIDLFCLKWFGLLLIVMFTYKVSGLTLLDSLLFHRMFCRKIGGSSQAYSSSLKGKITYKSLL